MIYFYIEEMRQLENKFSDKLELVNKSWIEVVNDFDEKFQSD